MCDQIKRVSGCGVCGADDLLAEELEWYDTEKQRMSNNDAMILMPYNTVLTRMSVVCLTCVIALRDIKIPAIGEKNGDTCSN